MSVLHPAEDTAAIAVPISYTSTVLPPLPTSSTVARPAMPKRLQCYYVSASTRPWTRCLAEVVFGRIYWGKSPLPRLNSPSLPSAIQLTLRATRRPPHDASRFMHAIFAWSTSARCTSCRQYRDARVYSHTTTAMHGISTPPPPGLYVLSIAGLASVGNDTVKHAAHYIRS